MKTNDPPNRSGLRIATLLAALLPTCAVLVVDAMPAASQVHPTVTERSRVRITALSLGLTEAVGTVRELTPEGLVVQFENPRLLGTVERDQISAIDVSIRSERHVLRGMGRGFLIGAASGLVLGLASGDDQGGFIAFTAEEKAAMLGAGLGLAGTVIGLVAGLATKHDVWSPGASIAPVDVALIPLVGPAGPGLQMGLSLKLN